MGVRHDGSWVKQERLNQIAMKISNELKVNRSIKIDKLVAWIEITIGLTRLKAREYVETVALAYDYIIANDCLKLPSVGEV